MKKRSGELKKMGNVCRSSVWYSEWTEGKKNGPSGCLPYETKKIKAAYGFVGGLQMGYMGRQTQGMNSEHGKKRIQQRAYTAKRTGQKKLPEKKTEKIWAEKAQKKPKIAVIAEKKKIRRKESGGSL